MHTEEEPESKKQKIKGDAFYSMRPMHGQQGGKSKPVTKIAVVSVEEEDVESSNVKSKAGKRSISADGEKEGDSIQEFTSSRLDTSLSTSESADAKNNRSKQRIGSAKKAGSEKHLESTATGAGTATLVLEDTALTNGIPASSTSAAPVPAADPTAAPNAVIDPALDSDNNVHVSRDETVKLQEDQGVIQFRCITNDDEDQNLIWLTGLKNIFSKQLPKMPREYIVRLVFDRKHLSMVIIKQNIVIGGITYRPHYNGPCRFAEIAFCAITSNEQVRGYGTRLMNHLKEHVKLDGISHFLTYADNYAIGYFKKQGFSKQIQLEREKWIGFIKDYDGGTLMECQMHFCINYLDIPGMVRTQKKAIYDKIKQICNSHVVYRGLEFADATAKSVPLESIRGLREAGWTPQMHRPPAKEGVQTAIADLKAELKSLLHDIKKHSSAWPFLKPVDPEEVEDYYDIIKEPVDLQTMEERLGKDHYKSKDQFVADLRRMFENCRMYNDKETRYYRCAEDLERYLNTKLKDPHFTSRQISSLK